VRREAVLPALQRAAQSVEQVRPVLIGCNLREDAALHSRRLRGDGAGALPVRKPRLEVDVDEARRVVEDGGPLWVSRHEPCCAESGREEEKVVEAAGRGTAWAARAGRVVVDE